MSKEHQINEEIRDREVRLIGPDGNQIGVVSIDTARNMAEQEGVDLVKIAGNAQPPVCKIMDYGKFKFEQSKKEKESKKNQHTVEIKEIRLSLNIDSNDLNTKVGHVRRFAESGHKTKVTVRFRGRELAHPELGYDLMNKFADACLEFANVERAAKLEGRSMSMIMASKPKAKVVEKQAAPESEVLSLNDQKQARNTASSD